MPAVVTDQLHVRCPQHQRNQFSFILELCRDFIDVGLVVVSKGINSDLALASLRFAVWGITVVFEVSIDLFLNLSTPLTKVLLGLYVWVVFMWKITAI